MRWVWDPAKDRLNRRKHGIGFETARRVFEDPLALSRQDTFAGEERWQTIGLIGPVIVLVIHTLPSGEANEEVGRIVSARKATPRERRAYEGGSF